MLYLYIKITYTSQVKGVKMTWITQILKGIRWLILKLGMLAIAAIALLALYSHIFSPAIKHGWTVKNIGRSLPTLGIFLGITVACLFLFYLSIWIFTGSERDRGGKCPTTRYYIVFGLWTLIYAVSLAKYIA